MLPPVDWVRMLQCPQSSSLLPTDPPTFSKSIEFSDHCLIWHHVLIASTVIVVAAQSPDMVLVDAGQYDFWCKEGERHRNYLNWLSTLTSVYNCRFQVFYQRDFCHRSARWVQSWWLAEVALNSRWLSHLQQGWKELRRALCSPGRDVTLLTKVWDPTFSKPGFSKGRRTTDLDDLLLKEADVDSVNVDVNLVQERYLLVTATSDVLSLHLQLCQTNFLDIVPPGKNVGVRALEMMGDAIKCFVVRIPWYGAPVKL